MGRKKSGNSAPEAKPESVDPESVTPEVPEVEDVVTSKTDDTSTADSTEKQMDETTDNLDKMDEPVAQAPPLETAPATEPKAENWNKPAAELQPPQKEPMSTPVPDLKEAAKSDHAGLVPSPRSTGPTDAATDAVIDAAMTSGEGESDTSTEIQTISMTDEIVLLFVIIFASIIVMIAGARNCDTNYDCKNEDAWAISAGTISVGLCIVQVALGFLCPAIHNKIQQVFGVCLCIWWLCGVGAGTFEGPFKETSNGYFAEWLAFGCSFYYMTLVSPWLARVFGAAHLRATETHEQRYAAMIIALSFIEVLASLVECTDVGNCTDEYLWALVCGSTSILICLIYVPCHERFKTLGISKWLAYFLVLWWVFGTGVLTFDKPFTVTGNGFFACWGCVGVSALFAMEAGEHADTANLLPVGVTTQPSDHVQFEETAPAHA